MSYFVKDDAISFGRPPDGEVGWVEYADLASARDAVSAPEPEPQPDWDGFLAEIRVPITLPIMDALATDSSTLHGLLLEAFANIKEDKIQEYWNLAAQLSPAFVAALNAEHQPGQTRAERIREVLGAYTDGRSENYNIPVRLNGALNLVQA
ncbi:MAG: hypothetical protein HC910_22070 [Spirulinaceae cyanobacterium SM2_1_0]|nr:hypothetical protein [Spirulinaceae cyanobacterium SM2_1_0]